MVNFFNFLKNKYTKVQNLETIQTGLRYLMYRYRMLRILKNTFRYFFTIFIDFIVTGMSSGGGSHHQQHQQQHQQQQQRQHQVAFALALANNDQSYSQQVRYSSLILFPRKQIVPLENINSHEIVGNYYMNRHLLLQLPSK